MDRFKFTTVAHARHRMCSPISDARLNQLIDLLDLDEKSTVLDVATGKAELPIRIIERYCCRATGVDINPAFLTEASEQVAQRIPKERLTLIECEGGSLDAPAESFDLACCLGARPFGDYAATLRRLKGWVKPGGLILIGEGYWKTQPAAELLSYLDCTEAEYSDHAGNQRLAAEHGLVPLYCTTASDEEFDHYQGLYVATMVRYLRRHPEDPDGDQMHERIIGMQEAYARWMRDMLGFGYYLCMK